VTRLAQVLLLFDSRGGLTEQLADSVQAGIEDTGATCVRRRIDDAIPADLIAADGMVLGSPNRSGMTGKLKEWWDYSGDLWQTGELAGKPAGAFTAGYSRSGGIEVTLLQLLHLLVSHGMVFVGLPWDETMRLSGSYYGATAHGQVTDDDRAQARQLGARVALFASRLASTAPRA
jgi:NAD(P)H dehydrogenase (quinone)